MPRYRLAPWGAVLLLAIGGLGEAARGMPSDAQEQANCDRVSQITEANAAPVMATLERLARERFGRGFSELSPEQVVQLAQGANVEGHQMTAAQERMAERCAAYQQRQMAKSAAAGGFRSLLIAQGYLDRWGRERVAGLGCSCPDFQMGGEEVDHRCSSPPICPVQRGWPRSPDPERGCRSIGAAAWILAQLPEFYRILGFPPNTEEVPDVGASLARSVPPSGCARLPTPTAAPLSTASLAAASPQSPVVPLAFPGAIGQATACFARPTAPTCQGALRAGETLVIAAKRAGRDRCLGYALTARTLWALGADPRFTDLLISYPEASRLRNEARIALRYLRMDCRGL